MFKNLPLWFSQILKKNKYFFNGLGAIVINPVTNSLKCVKSLKKRTVGVGRVQRGGRVIYLVLRGVQLTLNHLLSQKLVESLESVIQKTSCRCARHFENTAYLLIFKMRKLIQENAA